jgi:hypothetical protein
LALFSMKDLGGIRSPLGKVILSPTDSGQLSV